MAFKKGDSNINRTGRPKGTPDRRSELRELIRPHAPELITTAVNLAKKGDVSALRLLLDKVIPSLKPVSEPISLDTSGNDVTTLAAEVFRAATAGELALDEAAVLTSILLNRARIADADEANRNIEEATRRIQALQNDMTILDWKRINEQVTEAIKQKCTSCTKKRR